MAAEQVRWENLYGKAFTDALEQHKATWDYESEYRGKCLKCTGPVSIRHYYVDEPGQKRYWLPSIRVCPCDK